MAADGRDTAEPVMDSLLAAGTPVTLAAATADAQAAALAAVMPVDSAAALMPAAAVVDSTAAAVADTAAAVTGNRLSKETKGDGLRLVPFRFGQDFPEETSGVRVR
jgi:hypothetical protein